MRAVWSFWSKPFRGEKGRLWRSPLHHILASAGARAPPPSLFRNPAWQTRAATRLDFIASYAPLAIDLMLNPVHAPAWATFPDRAGFNMVVEQFLLQSCFEFHPSHPQSPFRGMQ